MFQMTFSACAFERLHCVYLRCECGNEIYIDTDNFKEVTETYVILKKMPKLLVLNAVNLNPETNALFLKNHK